MAAEKTILRSEQARRFTNTKEYWDAHDGLIQPKKGDIYIYTNAYTMTVNGEQVELPAVKIGNGNAYLCDLAFLGQYEAQEVLNHINDNIRHITQEEREKWNHKIDWTDAEVEGGTLIFTRE